MEYPDTGILFRANNEGMNYQAMKRHCKYRTRPIRRKGNQSEKVIHCVISKPRHPEQDKTLVTYQISRRPKGGEEQDSGISGQ